MLRLSLKILRHQWYTLCSKVLEELFDVKAVIVDLLSRIETLTEALIPKLLVKISTFIRIDNDCINDHLYRSHIQQVTEEPLNVLLDIYLDISSSFGIKSRQNHVSTC